MKCGDGKKIKISKAYLGARRRKPGCIDAVAPKCWRSVTSEVKKNCGKDKTKCVIDMQRKYKKMDRSCENKNLYMEIKYSCK